MAYPNHSTQIPKKLSGFLKLGSVQRVFQINPLHRWWSLIVGTLSTCGACLAVIYAAFDTSVQVARFGPIMAGNTLSLPLIVTIMLIIPGIFALTNAYKNWNKSVVVYESGLAYSDNRGTHICFWQDVEWFYAAITKPYHAFTFSSSAYKYTLQKFDGTKFKLDNKFENIELLGKIISQKVTPHQYRKLVRSLSNRQAVKFGSVVFDKETLLFNNITYTWNEIDSLEIRNGYATINKIGNRLFNRARIPLSAIPNLDTFCTAVKQIVQVNIAD